MHKEKFVFAQLADFLNGDKFRHIVDKYKGNNYVKSFTCWNQLLVLMFGQLSNRKNLRDLALVITAHHKKNFHLGFGKSVTLSNLSKANTNRDFRIFEEFAYYMIGQARAKRIQDVFELGGNVYAFDSTTIDLCLSVYEWARFRRAKGGIKIHTLYDLEAQVPAFIHITEASVNDVRAMDEIPYEPGAFYVFDLDTTTSRGSASSASWSRSVIQEPLADRAVLQMDEAAPQHPEVLGNDRKRRPHPDIFRHHGVLSGSHSPSRPEA